MLGLFAITAFQSLGAPLDDPKMKGAMVCAIVTNMDGKVIFERNADQRVMPASNEKLFTCAFALAQRGAEYQSTTKFTFNKNVVTIAASGDPTISSADIADLRNKFHVGSGHKIQIWQAYECDRPDTWQIGDAPNRYAPAIHALSVDKAGFELQAGPKGVTFEPHMPALTKFEYRASGGSMKLDYDPLASTLLVSGKLPSTQTKIDTLSDPNPSQTALFLLTGTKSPTLEKLDEPPTTAPTTTLYSPPISVLIKNCLQPSDNCLAEHLLMIGSKASSYREARKSISEWLRSNIGLSDDYFKIEDGSGLSRKNQTTVRNISKLLKWTTEQKTSELWQESLAHSGFGTLAKRLKGVDFIGKTGSLDMVSALSGFVKCRDGETRIVSVILNHYGCSESDARDVIDRFIENVGKQ